MLGLVLFGLIVLAATAANARDDSTPASGFVEFTPRIVMPNESPIRERGPRRETPPLLGVLHMHRNFSSSEPEGPSLSFGPIPDEMQPPMSGKRHKKLGHIDVDGLSLLGASVGGSVSGHGGAVTLVWPLFGP